MRKAVVYTRVSTKKQEGGYSLRTQEEDCREWCARNDHMVHAVVSDTHSGHDSLSKRPGIQKVLQMFLHREVDTLVVWKIDRSSRSTHDNQRLFDVVSGCDGTLVSVMDGIIENSPEGILMLGVHSYKGEKERADTKARTERGIEARVKEGYILTSAVPLYGYRWAYEVHNHRMRKTIYEVDDAAADVVRGMYKRAVEGWTIRHICRDLNERGVPSPSMFLHLRGELPEGRGLADHWERSTAYNVLTNESYTGRHVVRRRESYQEKHWDEETWTSTDIERRRLRAEDDPKRAVVDIPAIVDPEQWELVQGKIKARALSTAGDVDDALLNRGIAYCGVCGAKMVAIWHHSGQQRVYVCGKRPGTPVNKEQYCPGKFFAVPARKVDPAIWAFVTEIIRDQPRYERMVRSKSAKFAEEHAEALREAESLQKTLEDRKAMHARVDRRRHAQEDDYLAALDGQELKRLAGEIADLEQRVKAAHGTVNSVERQLQAHKRLIERIKQSVARYPTNPAHQARFKEELAKQSEELIKQGLQGIDPALHMVIAAQMPAMLDEATLDRLTREEKRDTMRDLGLQVLMHPIGYVDAKGVKHERWEPRIPEDVLLSSTPDCR